MIPKKHYPLIRTIYLYLFALVGLSLLVIGIIKLVDLGLKAFIFTKAEEQERLYDIKPPVPYDSRAAELEQIGEGEVKVEELTEADVQLIKQWLEDYERWQEANDGFDAVASRRHQDASTGFSFIIVGLPLFLYHWRLIRKETKQENYAS